MAVDQTKKTNKIKKPKTLHKISHQQILNVVEQAQKHSTSVTELNMTKLFKNSPLATVAVDQYDMLVSDELHQLVMPTDQHILQIMRFFDLPTIKQNFLICLVIILLAPLLFCFRLHGLIMMVVGWLLYPTLILLLGFNLLVFLQMIFNYSDFDSKKILTILRLTLGAYLGLILISLVIYFNLHPHLITLLIMLMLNGSLLYLILMKYSRLRQCLPI